MALTPPIAFRYRNAIAGVRPPEGDAVGGAGRDRTGDPLVANQVLSQLSYSPPFVVVGRRVMVGLSGFEPLTSRLSAVRSSQLSYRPVDAARQPSAFWILLVAKEQNGRPEAAAGHGSLKTR